MSEEPDHPARLDKAVRRRMARRERWRKEGERPMAMNLAMIGALGWTTVVPILAGIFLGRWLDRTYDTGVFWTLGLLVAGVALGWFLGWKRMQGE